MDDILVHHAEMAMRGDQPFYVISIEHEQHEDFVGLRGHIMPTDVFESRAAQYDIDPEAEGGWDEILQVTFFSTAEHPSIEDHLADPDHLLNAPSIAHAREAALKRARRHLGKRKLRGLSGGRGGLRMSRATPLMKVNDDEDPLDFIKRTAPMSPEHMHIKREFVRRQRADAQVRRASEDQVKRDMRLNPKRESPEELAHRLFGQVPEYWTDDGLTDKQRNARFDFAARDINDIPRNRLPSREGAPSKYL